MKLFFFLIYFFLLCNSFLASAQKVKYTKDIGVFFEVHNDTTNLSRFTEDNEIYKGGNTYHYSFEYFDKNGFQKYFRHNSFVKKTSRMDRWEFAPIGDSIVAEYSIKILYGLEGHFLSIKNYSQTLIKYSFQQLNGEEYPVGETTGLVENKKNIWLHPPRTDLLAVLELNPFPCVRFPLKIGKKWKGNLEIGPGWSDERWKIYEDKIINKYQYRITGICNIDTELGILECYIIEAVAKSRIGKTYLTSYFNSQYGFVRYEYINIDGSRIIINLKQIDIE